MSKKEEFQPKFGETCTVNVSGNMWVEVCKLFGPQSSSKIRVMHDIETCQWVVHEENFNNGEWVERARFDAQEFYDEKYNTDET